MADKMTAREAAFFARKGNKKLAAHERREAAGKEEDTPAMAKREMAFMKANKAPASMIKHEESEMSKMNCGGKVKYARGGGIESKGKTRGTVVKMARGGSVSSRADGCVTKGRTRGKFV